MFRNNTNIIAAEADLPHDVVVTTPAEPVPVSVLALDLPAPAIGWPTFLAGRGIEIVIDDVGRDSISRADARMLLDERREDEIRRRQIAERQEQQAVEADRVRRASIWSGLPAIAIPEGVSAASAMFAADREARPRRQSPLQHALSNDGGIVFHPIRGDGDQS
jgi:hypothetical protein